MQPKPLAIGVFARHTSGHYYGAMLSSIHQITRAAGVPLLVIQGELQDLRLPPYGADYVDGWISSIPLKGSRQPGGTGREWCASGNGGDRAGGDRLLLGRRR
jgi:hypothetical protein